MATVSAFSKNVEFNANELAINEFNYVKKNGVFAVTLQQVFGDEANGSSFLTYDFVIDGSDDLLSIRELYTYTDKTTGEAKESKGANLLRAMVGFAAGKGKAVARWTPVKKSVFGKEVSGMELKSLAGKKFYVTSQVERKIYKNKAQENNSIRRIFSADGLALAEFKDALTAITASKITKFAEFEGKALTKEQGKKSKYKYKACTADEWEEAKGESTTDGSTATGDTSSLPSMDSLPSLPESSLESSLPTIEKPAETEAPALPVVEQNALPTTQQEEVPATTPPAPEGQVGLPTLSL